MFPFCFLLIFCFEYFVVLSLILCVLISYFISNYDPWVCESDLCRIYVEWLKVELEGLVNTIPYTLSDKTCCKKMHFKSKTRLCFTSFDIIVNVYLNIEIIRTFRLYQISGWQLFLPKCIVDSDEVNTSALHNRDNI